MEEKKKRVYMRIGDIFCVNIDNEYKQYFQYIAVDTTQLNSRVIRVFNTKYPLSLDVNVENVINDKVSFYCHTFITIGIEQGYWYKVGKNKDIGNTEDLYFKNITYGNFNDIKISDRWEIWQINHPFIFTGKLPITKRCYELGDIFPPIDIYTRIKTGKYRGNISNIL